MPLEAYLKGNRWVHKMFVDLMPDFEIPVNVCIDQALYVEASLKYRVMSRLRAAFIVSHDPRDIPGFERTNVGDLQTASNEPVK